MDGSRDLLPFLGRRLAPGFTLRVVFVEAGRSRPYRAGEWAGALVVVERGRLLLRCRSGSSREFGVGTVLWLENWPLLGLDNPGPEVLTLSVVTRTSHTRGDGDDFSCQRRLPVGDFHSTGDGRARA